MPTENYDSRDERLTMYGYQFTTKYTATRAETLDPRASGLPLIGDYWSPARPDIRCSDVEIRQLAGNTHAIITATWSTECGEYRRGRPNQIASWEDSLEITTEETVIESWIDSVTGKPVSWAEMWKAASEDNTDDNRPILTKHTPRMVYTCTVYGSASLIGRFMEAAGKINSTDFISQVQTRIMKVKTKESDAIAFHDAGKLLFMGCRRTPTNSENYKYELHFLYNHLGWNNPYNLDPDLTGSFEIYESMEFYDLLSGMDYIEDDPNMGFYND